MLLLHRLNLNQWVLEEIYNVNVNTARHINVYEHHILPEITRMHESFLALAHLVTPLLA